AYPNATVVTVLDSGGGAADALALQANTGDMLAYTTTAPPPAAFTTVNNIILFEPGSDLQEAHSIGELSTLSLLVPLSEAIPAGAIVQHVTAADDDRTVINEANNPRIELDRVDGLAIGMTLTFEVGGVAEDHLIDAINTATREVTLRTPLSAATSNPAVL